MKTKLPINTNPNEVPASLSPELLDRLADLVVAKPIAKNHNGEPSKHTIIVSGGVGLCSISLSNMGWRVSS
ncbi:hypothetical protein ACFLX3_01790 [Chloroflexota bacterium]